MGYQVTGYFAITSRFGSPDDLKYLIDRLHRAGFGVLMDWVPGHFPKDDWALAKFDGEHSTSTPDPRRGEQKDWGTYVFDYGNPRVRNFLVANALLLARGDAHRRTPRRRGRLDAVPRLLARGRRVAAEHPRRPRAPRGDRIPAGGDRDRTSATPAS